jgi:hypothetical protein
MRYATFAAQFMNWLRVLVVFRVLENMAQTQLSGHEGEQCKSSRAIFFTPTGSQAAVEPRDGAVKPKPARAVVMFLYQDASGRLSALYSAIIGVGPSGLIPYHGVIANPVGLCRIREHGDGEGLLRCRVPIELYPYCHARHPANDDFFHNHCPVLLIEKKDDIIPLI